MSEDIYQHDYRVGDVLRVTCPPTATRVAKVLRSYVAVYWPWGEIDPDSRYRWNGQRAFPKPNSWEWGRGLFRTDPEPQHLVPGDTCLVGIPETLVRVVDVIHHDPPEDTGHLPRPHTTLVVLPVDQPQATDRQDNDDEGDVLRLDSVTPITLHVVSRD